MNFEQTLIFVELFVVLCVIVALILERYRFEKVRKEDMNLFTLNYDLWRRERNEITQKFLVKSTGDFNTYMSYEKDKLKKQYEYLHEPVTESQRVEKEIQDEEERLRIEEAKINMQNFSRPDKNVIIGY